MFLYDFIRVITVFAHRKGGNDYFIRVIIMFLYDFIRVITVFAHRKGGNDYFIRVIIMLLYDFIRVNTVFAHRKGGNDYFIRVIIIPTHKEEGKRTLYENVRKEEISTLSDYSVPFKR